MTIELFLYSQQDCQLCDEFKKTIEPFLTEKNVILHDIDIGNDLELKQRYAARIPVLVCGNTEICEVRVDQQALQSFLSSHSD
ncbi:MAG: glutaredoxin family protein [Gammaproteobacteria bacterium]|nr:glutaredoxin family protein [Gammaproteobacteria bacterium]